MTGYLPEAQWYSLREGEFGKVYKPGYNRFSAKTTELIPVLARGLHATNSNAISGFVFTTLLHTVGFFGLCFSRHNFLIRL